MSLLQLFGPSYFEAYKTILLSTSSMDVILGLAESEIFILRFKPINNTFIWLAH